MTLRTVRRVGALALVVVGAVHLQQYLGGGYRSIPTIGPLFLLNAIGAGLVALGLLAPIERVLSNRAADLAAGMLAATAVGIAAGSLVAVVVSENGTLFGFSESGYRSVIVLAIIAESAAVVLLAPVAAIDLMRAASRRTEPGSTQPVSSR
jgi:hypothetical protein